MEAPSIRFKIITYLLANSSGSSALYSYIYQSLSTNDNDRLAEFDIFMEPARKLWKKDQVKSFYAISFFFQNDRLKILKFSKIPRFFSKSRLTLEMN